MDDDVGAVLDRADQIGRRQRVVDDQRDLRLLGDHGDGADVGDDAAGIGDRLDEDRLGLVVDRGAQGVEIVGIGPAHLPAEILEGVIELVDRAAVELGRGDEFVAGLHQRVEDDRLRGVAGGDGERRRRALERGDALFQRRRRRVGDAGVDVAERLQAEQRGGVIDVVENEGGRLVDRRDPRARGRIGPRPGVDRQGGKAGFVDGGHGVSSAAGMVANSGGEGKRGASGSKELPGSPARVEIDPSGRGVPLAPNRKRPLVGGEGDGSATPNWPFQPVFRPLEAGIAGEVLGKCQVS